MARPRKVSRLVIANMLADPSLKQGEIAKSLGVSSKTVMRVSNELKRHLENTEENREQYRRLMDERLPLKNRVGIIEEIAKLKKKNPFASLAAVARADAISGLAIDSKKEKKGEEDKHRPMFVLPAGSRVMIGIKTPEQEEPSSDRTEIDLFSK